MKSVTYGNVEMNQIAKIIMKRVQENPDSEFKVFVGTDSQNIGPITKIVPVILLNVRGHGGIFFYDVYKIKRINNIREKLNKETQISLSYADSLISEFDKLFNEFNFDYSVLNISIHVDAGEKGETGKLMAEISGWIHAFGYDCSFKPNSYAASTVADRISK